MTIVPNNTLIDCIRKTGLLSADQLDVLLREAPARTSDARTTSRIMLQHGWLTVYQINQLLAGRGQELIIGNYHVMDRLGQGGQSTVFKARHRDEKFIVALKVIKAELLANPEASQQFMQEMEAMVSLNHPNIVQFIDADKVGETYYCALEFVEGTDLGKYVRLAGRLPAAEASNYIRQTALGLQHAHERSLIHRDIKPVNLCLTGEPKSAEPGVKSLSGTGSTVKILDWGLASLRPPTVSDAATSSQARSLIGTADYLSPEQAINPDGVDIRADIYSLGCTFYYLLAGHPPFPDGTVMQKVLRHQRDMPKAIDDLRPDLPLGLAAIVKRMIAKKPDDRYQTPASVGMALKPYSDLDRFLLPRLNREGRYRLGLENDSARANTPLPEHFQEDSSSKPQSKGDTRTTNTGSSDTIQRWTENG